MILTIETSTDVCSVALAKSRNDITTKMVHEPNAHAAHLTPLIESILKEAGVEPRELQAIAVSSGPGSYTGLRIGASTAKGMCYALSIPLIAVPTLDVLTYALLRDNAEAEIAVPMIDARRMEVYTQATTRNGERLMAVTPLVVDETAYAEILASGKRVVFGGNGAMKCSEVIKAPNATFVSGIETLARDMVDLAYDRLEAGQTESVAYFEPFYLKEFVATVAKNKVF